MFSSINMLQEGGGGWGGGGWGMVRVGAQMPKSSLQTLSIILQFLITSFWKDSSVESKKHMKKKAAFIAFVHTVIHV